MTLTFNEYQYEAQTTMRYPYPSKITYPILGLNGEAGEVAEKYKKILRDQDGDMTPTDVDAIAKELGDVLWYLAAIATDLGLSLEEVAKGNMAKLQGRAERGTLAGSGDER